MTANMRNGTIYIGQSSDIGLRMQQHKSGFYEGFSKDNHCTRLVWFEEHDTRQTAFTRERQLKAWRRRWKIELIEKHNPHWWDISEMLVWPLPQAAIFEELRKQAIKDGREGERNPR